MEDALLDPSSASVSSSAAPTNVNGNDSQPSPFDSFIEIISSSSSPPDACQNAIADIIFKVASSSDPTLSFTFPATLTSPQRKAVHDIADTYGIFHWSTGQPPSRTITISKQPPPPSIEPQFNPNKRKSTQSNSDAHAFVLFSTEVAVVAGLNPYERLSAVFEKLWLRTEPNSYTEAIKSLESSDPSIKFETKKQKVERIAEALNASSMLHSAEKEGAAALNSGAAREAEAKLVEELRKQALEKAKLEKIAAEVVEDKSKLIGKKPTPQVSKEELDLLEQHVRSLVRTEFGRNREKDVILDVEKQSEGREKILENNSEFISKSVGIVADRFIFIGGRIDGISSADGSLVEIKNRIKKFGVRFYDYTQVQCYLHLLNLPKGKLIEYLKVEKTKSAESEVENENQAEASPPPAAASEVVSFASSSTQKVTKITRDTRFFEEVLLPRIQSFAQALFVFLADPEAQKTFLMADEDVREGLVMDYITTYKQQQQEPSSSSSASSVPEEKVHWDVECDGCGELPIRGTRYKCRTCLQFDLCAKCEPHKLEHGKWVRLRHPIPLINPVDVDLIDEETINAGHVHVLEIIEEPIIYDQRRVQTPPSAFSSVGSSSSAPLQIEE